MTRAEYLKELYRHMGRLQPQLLDAAIIFYHCEVPLEVAKGYLEKLQLKLLK